MRKATAALALVLTVLLGSSVAMAAPGTASAEGLPRCCV
jgi:hypothetical protein